MIITLLPRSRLRLADCAQAAAQAGQYLWWNGRALVAAPRKPGAGWYRMGVLRRMAA